MHLRSGYADWVFVTMKYGQKWREHRRAFHKAFHPDAIPQYYPVQLRATQALLQDLLDAPEEFSSHIRRCAWDRVCGPLRSVLMFWSIGRSRPRSCGPCTASTSRAAKRSAFGWAKRSRALGSRCPRLAHSPWTRSQSCATCRPGSPGCSLRRPLRRGKPDRLSIEISCILWEWKHW